MVWNKSETCMCVRYWVGKVENELRLKSSLLVSLRSENYASAHVFLAICPDPKLDVTIVHLSSTTLSKIAKRCLSY